MTVHCTVRPGAYFDSVVLMRIAADVGSQPGVRTASLVMATESNKAVLAGAGLLDQVGEAAGPNDLVIAVDADDDAVEAAMAAGVAGLERGSPASQSGERAPQRPRSLAQVQDARLALISTPGEYAAAEALKALRRGLSVFIFSNNVPVEQEVQLKREAHERGLLVMGPDCGTAIISGVPLGFANVVERGDIGLIGASGTGMQQISTLVDRWGAGISQAIGVGGHDLSAEVGAVSMIDSVAALGGDAETRVIVLVSKPPDPEVAAAVLERAAATGKPVVAAFLGADRGGAPDGVEVVATLEDAARAAVRLSTGAEPPGDATAEVPALHGERRLLRGLYSGGTFAHEARVLLEPSLGAIGEDAGADHDDSLPDGHLIVDLGDDRFTQGRPHPMIDPTARLAMLRAAGRDPRTAIVILDIVLGYGAAEDPASDLAPAIAEITARADAPLVLAFLVGAKGDPQDLTRQEQTLRDAGAAIAFSSTAAARIARAALTPEVLA